MGSLRGGEHPPNCPESKASAILEEAGSMTLSCHFPPVHMLRRIGFRGALLLAIGVGCASNRQAAPTTTSIPVPLASALIDGRGSMDRPTPDFTVGTLPPGFPVKLVPSAPARIVGGMKAGDEL